MCVYSLSSSSTLVVVIFPPPPTSFLCRSHPCRTRKPGNPHRAPSQLEQPHWYDAATAFFSRKMRVGMRFRG